MANEKYESLADLFLLKMQALYEVENQLIKALPKMAKKATDPDLKEAFESHLQETKEHARRIEQIFDLLEEKASRIGVDAIDGLIADAEWCIDNIKSKEVLDASLIAAAQYVEHYEIAGYGSAREWAQLLEYPEALELLDETLDEEKAADEKLSEIASDTVNEAATEEAESEDDK